MFSLPVFRKRFTSRWWLIILAFLMIAMLLRLGFWQMARASEKEHMLNRKQSYDSRLPQAWSFHDKNPAHYQRIKLTGEFQLPVLLLDNQHHNHQFGYHVISPFKLTNDAIVLIDRGWLPGDRSRRQLPEIKTPDHEIVLTGYAYYPPAQRITLGQMLDQQSNDMAIIEWIDTQDISHFLHKSVYPFIIRLDERQAHGFIRSWPVVSMPPARHKAYAFQWFAMALVLFIIVIALSVKKKL